MARQNKDPSMAGSSILLLQERFKQLQKLKEMREGRQLLQLLPQPTYDHDKAADLRTSFSPSEACFQEPVALGLNSKVNHTENYRVIKPKQLYSSTAKGPYSSMEKPDVVDTSLRL